MSLHPEYLLGLGVVFVALAVWRDAVGRAADKREG